MPLKFSEIVRISLIVLLMITGGGTFISGQTPLVTGEINKYARVTTVGADFVVVDDVSEGKVFQRMVLFHKPFTFYIKKNAPFPPHSF